MGKETIDAMVDGGKASAGPPLGPALGPMGVNIGEVISKINEKTASFNGMQVPVKVIIDTDTKEIDVEVGTPPASALIKKEAKVEKGSGNPLQDKVADIKIEQVIKIAKMKEDDLAGKGMKEKVKEVIGTCNSMGILVEGVPAKEAIQLVNDGRFDEEIRTEKTEISAEELKALEEERKKLAAEMEERRAEFEATAKQIIEQNKGAQRSQIKAKLVEAKIPAEIIEELLPVEAAAPAEGEAKAEEAPKEEEKK